MRLFTNIQRISTKMSTIMGWLLIVGLIVGGYPEWSFSAKSDRGLYINTGREKKNQIIDSKGEEVLLYKESHALIIGISEYTSGWPNLPGVKKDIEEVKITLEKQEFNVVVHMDLDKNGLDQAFTDFISRYGQDPDNRLVFYFAGHGHTVKTTYGEELGYIVPVDAPNPHYDMPTFQSKAMEMQQVEIYAKRIQSKHALFLFDACFSGSLFATSRAVPEVINYKTAQPVRQFITSGSADETVPDESVFRAQFARAMEGEADSDGDGYVTGTELGEFLQTTVVNYSKNSQHPQYGKIRNPNLDKGDFVFLLPTQQSTKDTALAFDSPSDTAFSLEDLTEIADREQEVKAAWQTRLDDMEAGFSQVTELEKRNISKEFKIKAWERFIDAFSEDNPYSTRDNELLSMAEERIEHWGNYTIAPTPEARPKPVFRVNEVVITDADGKLITPKNNTYTIKKDKTITITMDIADSQGYTPEFIWTTGQGKLPPTDQNTNTYTAAKLGDDYVTVYVWDKVTGQDLLELSMNLTVVPQAVPTDEFRIERITIKDAYGKVITPENEVYTIKKGETVTITVDVATSYEQTVEFAWTTGRGRVPVSDQKTNTYTARKTGGDYVTIFIWDRVVGKELAQTPINIRVVP